MSKQLSFTRRRFRPSGKLIVLSLVSIALMVLDSRHGAVQQAKSYAATALQPLQWLANQPVRWYQASHAFFRTQNQLLSENSRLQAENRQLHALSLQHSSQKRELEELRALNRLQAHGITNSQAAEIISTNKDPLADKFVLNKGSQSQIQAGDAVIDRQGLIGQITQVRSQSAELTLLSNAQNVIPVMVARTGIRSLVHGNGNGIELRYFPTDADLQVNDVLITSGLDSVYPQGIPVAKVTAVQRASGTPYYRASLSILAQTRSSKQVLVLAQKAKPAAVIEHEQAIAQAAASAAATE
ncbi:MAG: rod shape-determining protein MreC [Neisseria sp.]|nr:rod shape-determining protein MreC [Neisseria sp.]